MEYDLELDRVVKEIKKQKAKTVCVQLADGLKLKATEIVDFIEMNTTAKCFIWLGSCFGGCDYPKLEDIDLLVQFGHSEFI